MELSEATRSLSALAQPSRLAIFRLLLQAGPEGMSAGDIARRTATAPNTLTAQLQLLTGADLAWSVRQGRSIRYGANYAGIALLLSYLIEDCCEGRPEVCTPLQDALQRAVCCSLPITALVG